ncbi:hypothetical protein ACO0K9_19335 [Undibacterium sp. Ji50W]|uniref:hypothetical protein n=1 Tax=Undibacterium sp. Ji50W TaxID=3413041 RepID=UPI003BF359D3
MSAIKSGATLASNEFSVDTNFVNVRVKGLDRSKIPGSFKIHLLKDGKVIASRAFYQGSETSQSEDISGSPAVHFDFELPITAISEGKLGVQVEPLDKTSFGDRFPFDLMGSPTVNVRLLVTDE